MSEEVLGFRKTDAYRTKQKLASGMIHFYHIDPEKLVPVVSLERLNNKVKKGLTQRPKQIIKYQKLQTKDRKSFFTLGYRTALNDLLYWAREESSK